MSASRRSTAMDSVAYHELGDLMKEFPDWKQDHPDIANEMFPTRYTKNKNNAPNTDTMALKKKRASTVPVLSDYQDTYKYHNNRPRSTKRPPRTPRDPHPPPMTLQSSMRAEYPPKFHQSEGRPEAMKLEDNYSRSTDKFNSQSAYQVDYPFKKPQPQDKLDKAPSSNIKREPGKFDGMTTSKEYFRNWKQPRTLAFRELPTFTDSILYPNKTRSLETTTNATFKGTCTTKPEPYRLSSPNIKIEGDQNFETVNSLTYQRYNGATRAVPVIHRPELGTRNTKSKFNTQTQSQRDFGSTYDRGVPVPPRPYEAPKSSIDLKFDNRCSFETEQRRQYMGIDVEKNPIPDSYKPDSGDYVAPTTKFETLTNQKIDYKPIDISTTKVEIAKPPSQKIDKTLPKFDGTTTSNQYFRKWDVQPRPYYGDVHEALQYVRSDQYIPRTEKFNATSTTMDQFTAKTADIPIPFIPEGSKLDSSGKIDFNTVYRNEFDSVSVVKNIPKKQASQLLKELRMRKNERQGYGVHKGQQVIKA